MRRCLIILSVLLWVKGTSFASDFISFPSFPTRGQGSFDRGSVWWNDATLTFYAPFDDPENPLRLINGTGSFSFTRATTATYVHPTTGLVTGAASGQLRIESDGALIEGARTNDLLWSRDFTNAAWVKVNATAAKDQTGEDGVVSSASSLTATGANGTCLESVTLGSESRTGAVSIKRITGTGTVKITMDGGLSWSTDLAGSLSTTSWYRASRNQTVLNPSFGIQIGTSGDVIAVDYTQEEAGEFASSRIPTTMAAVTRNSDLLYIAVNGNVDEAAGVAGARISLPYATTAPGVVRQFLTSGSGSLLYSIDQLTDIAAYDGANVARDTTMNWVSGAAREVASRWRTGVLSVIRDGTTITEAGAYNGNILQSINIYIGVSGDGSGSFMFGHIKNLRIWNRAFSDSELQAITQ